MKAIKNYESFKKSLLSSTNGTMVESLDSSNIFAGCEYQSYRVYVDDVHYYNMFVIHNFASNSYDVSLETSNCAVSTMSRVVKTQKAMIESVCRWCYYSYLNTKEISVDSEEYTDMCEETNENENAVCARGNDVFDGCKTEKEVMEVKQELNSRFGKEITTPSVLDVMVCIMCHADSASGNVTVEEIEDLDEHKEISDVENVCGDCSHFNACMQDYETNASTCCMCDSLNKAITNPEWHHVSLKTLANIDFDMLDKKRQVYLKAHQELKRTLADLSKCKTEHTYEARARKFIRYVLPLYHGDKISFAMLKYLDLQLSMSNVINGLWSSYVEPATGLHESRRYGRPTLK